MPRKQIATTPKEVTRVHVSPVTRVTERNASTLTNVKPKPTLVTRTPSVKTPLDPIPASARQATSETENNAQVGVLVVSDQYTVKNILE